MQSMNFNIACIVLLQWNVNPDLSRYFVIHCTIRTDASCSETHSKHACGIAMLLGSCIS